MLSEAKHLSRRAPRCFASLSMTALDLAYLAVACPCQVSAAINASQPPLGQLNTGDVSWSGCGYYWHFFAAVRAIMGFWIHCSIASGTLFYWALVEHQAPAES